MTEQGLMTEHGQALIDLAKADGTWQVVSDAHSSAIPPDLQELLDRKETARRNFHNFRTGLPGITDTAPGRFTRSRRRPAAHGLIGSLPCCLSWPRAV